MLTVQAPLPGTVPVRTEPGRDFLIFERKKKREKHTAPFTRGARGKHTIYIQNSNPVSVSNVGITKKGLSWCTSRESKPIRTWFVARNTLLKIVLVRMCTVRLHGKREIHVLIRTYRHGRWALGTYWVECA